MPIQIIDNFELTSQKPIDNRLVVGPNSFYTNKDDITNKYNGLRIWELPGSNIGSGATNSTPIGLGYVWTGTSWGSENTTAISGGGTADRLAYFNSSNTIQSSNIYFNGTNIGVGGAAEAVGPGSRLVVSGNIKSIGGQFIGNGSGLTTLNATQLTQGTVPIGRFPTSTPGWILTADSAAPSYKNPSSITVGTASALQTTRTIWGRDFNGTGNVTGNIVGAGTIQFGLQANKATIFYNENSTRTLTVPSLGGDRTFAFIDQAQTFSANNTFSGANIFSGANTFSGANILKVADGSLTVPSIAFNGDTNTGIYRIGTDQFALVAGGVNIITVGTSSSSGYGRGQSGLDLRNGLQNISYESNSLSYSNGKNLIEAGEFVNLNDPGPDVYQWWQRIGRTVFVSFKIVGAVTSTNLLKRPIASSSSIIGTMNYGNGNYNTPGIVSGSSANWIIKNSYNGDITSGVDLVMGFYSYLL